MSVVAQFGITADSITRLIDNHWLAWMAQAPDLHLRPTDTPLDQWVTRAPAVDVDRVLRALARLAHDDEPTTAQGAALVLVWLMMPAASMLANQLRTLDVDIDQHIAAQLWIEVRSYPWQTTGRVAANLRCNLRKHLLADFAEPELILFDQQPPDEPAPDGGDSMQEAVDFLEEGLEDEAITQDDFDLLLAVLDAADQLHPRPYRGGLTGNRVSNLVAAELGVTGRTVRRRTTRSIAALARYAGTDRRSA
ncbi:MAG: hypothetical protein IT193_08675 [Propionibacteriaceae bacterium]|nr:hypothetical protein [Propionibacteriaceae bacterium]